MDSASADTVDDATRRLIREEIRGEMKRFLGRPRRARLVATQERLLEALYRTRANVSRAAQRAGCSRQTYYTYLERFLLFRRAAEAIEKYVARVSPESMPEWELFWPSELPAEIRSLVTDYFELRAG